MTENAGCMGYSSEKIKDDRGKQGASSMLFALFPFLCW